MKGSYLFLLAALVALPLFGQRKVLKYPGIEYPRIALSAGEDGEVKIFAHVYPSGEVIGINFVSGPPLLVDTCKKMVHNWQFETGKDEKLTITFTFIFAETKEEEKVSFDPQTLSAVVRKIRPLHTD